MTDVLLLDTHVWAWSLSGTLPASLRAAIKRAAAIYVSPITFYEIGQKVRLGKWPEMEPLALSLPKLLEDQGGFAAPLTPAICLSAAMMDWAPRDPFDRIIAATSLAFRWPLASVDGVFDGCAQDDRKVMRVW